MSPSLSSCCRRRIKSVLKASNKIWEKRISVEAVAVVVVAVVAVVVAAVFVTEVLEIKLLSIKAEKLASFVEFTVVVAIVVAVTVVVVVIVVVDVKTELVVSPSAPSKSVLFKFLKSKFENENRSSVLAVVVSVAAALEAVVPVAWFRKRT